MIASSESGGLPAEVGHSRLILLLSAAQNGGVIPRGQSEPGDADAATEPRPMAVKEVGCAAAMRFRSVLSRPGSMRSCRSDGGTERVNDLLKWEIDIIEAVK